MRTTTTTLTRLHHQHWSKYWLCKLRCCKLCNRLWWTCNKCKVSSKHHNSCSMTSLESFSGPNLQPSLTLSSQWIPTIDWRPLRRSYKSSNIPTRVLFVAHPLVGPDVDWWNTYVKAHEEPKAINWQEFRNNFRTHYVSFGMMKLKKK
jgi:hypothetical protein